MSEDQNDLLNTINQYVREMDLSSESSNASTLSEQIIEIRQHRNILSGLLSKMGMFFEKSVTMEFKRICEEKLKKDNESRKRLMESYIRKLPKLPLKVQDHIIISDIVVFNEKSKALYDELRNMNSYHILKNDAEMAVQILNSLEEIYDTYCSISESINYLNELKSRIIPCQKEMLMDDLLQLDKSLENMKENPTKLKELSEILFHNCETKENL